MTRGKVIVRRAATMILMRLIAQRDETAVLHDPNLRGELTMTTENHEYAFLLSDFANALGVEHLVANTPPPDRVSEAVCRITITGDDDDNQRGL